MEADVQLRICPGRYMADNSLFLSIASILQAFNIGEATDKDGNVIPIEERWVSSLVV